MIDMLLRRTTCFCFFFFVVCCTTYTLASEANPSEVFIPDDAGLINVRDHGVKGDGISDDTAALRKLVAKSLNQHKTLFFPAGTYLLSDAIPWATEKGEFWPWLTWQGEGRGRTKIRLQDKAPGFGDPKRPKAFIKTGCYDGERRQNAAHNCYFFDLTIEIGRDNPGAVALDYCSNNNGAVVRVDFIAEEGSGHTGLSMRRDSPGPSLIQHVRIIGFETGIDLRHLLFGMTFEHIHLEGQRQVGLFVDGNVAAVRRLHSINRVPAIRLSGWAAALTLLDSELAGGAEDTSAILTENAPTLILRNVRTKGYQHTARIIMDRRESTLAAGKVDEYLVGSRFSLFGDAKKTRTLDLPIEEAPAYFGKPTEWSNVQKFGAKGNGEADDAPAIQKAIDSGKAVVYFPHGKYLLKTPVMVRGSVRRLIGFSSDFRTAASEERAVLFRVEKLDGPVSFERMYLNGKVEHAASQPVVFRHTLGPGVALEGENRVLHFEDVLTAKFTVPAKCQLYARQFNCEPKPPGAGFVNDGGQVWILGLKTEWGNTIGITRNSGQTEVLGGLLLPAQGFNDRTLPAFVVEDAAFCGSWNEITFGTGNYQNVVREIRKGEKKELHPEGEGTQRAWSLYSTREP
jgi:hypothetical protein